MPHEHEPWNDSLTVALQLIERLGERAVAASKVRLVETIAADDLPAAVFWRAVLRHCEQRAPSATPPLPGATAAGFGLESTG